MNCLTLSTFDILKYIIISGIIYYLLVRVPANKLKDKDLYLTMAIVIVSIIIIDNVFIKSKTKEKMDNVVPHNIYDKWSYVMDKIIQERTDEESLTKKIEEQQKAAEKKKEEDKKIEEEKKKEEENKKEDKPLIVVDKVEKKEDDPKTPYNDEIANRYFASLISDLKSKEILDDTEAENLKLKVENNILTLEEAIKSLENLKANGKIKVEPIMDKNSDMMYNELPCDFYSPIGDKIANEWDEKNEFVILNTDKWKVPMPKPPVCVNNTPCTVCPSESPNYLNLKNWNNARAVTNNSINRKWANTQLDTKA